MAISFAGCSAESDPSGGESTPADTATDTSTKNGLTTGTPEISTLKALEPGGNVLTQPSSNAPASVELTLTNPTKDAVSAHPVSFGTEPFESIVPLTGETGDVWLIPPGDPNVQVMGGVLPSEPENGCWRVVDTEENDERTPYIASTNFSEEGTNIASGETYSVQHEVYYHGPEDACFPAGNYQTTVELEIDDVDSRPRMAVTYVLSISEDREFTLRTGSVEYSQE